MPQNLTFNPGQSRTLEKPVSKVKVSVGSLVVHEDGVPAFAAAGESVTFAGRGKPVVLQSPDGAKATVTYADRAEADAPPQNTLVADLRSAEKVRDRVASAPDSSAREDVLRSAEARVRHAQRRLATFYPEVK